jgi:hypothetical protein
MTENEKHPNGLKFQMNKNQRELMYWLRYKAFKYKTAPIRTDTGKKIENLKIVKYFSGKQVIDAIMEEKKFSSQLQSREHCVKLMSYIMSLGIFFHVEKESKTEKTEKKKDKKKLMNAQDTEQAFMETTFNRMINEYDFMSLVMYPELVKRREFVHDAWLIGKLCENFELKLAISNDPYFYITRDDILQLLKTKDDQMIQHMLKNEIMLHIKEDMSYKLVKIKGG